MDGAPLLGELLEGDLAGGGVDPVAARLGDLLLGAPGR